MIIIQRCGWFSDPENAEKHKYSIICVEDFLGILENIPFPEHCQLFYFLPSFIQLYRDFCTKLQKLFFLRITFYLFCFFIISSRCLVGLHPFFVRVVAITLRICQFDCNASRKDGSDIMKVRLLLMAKVILLLFNFSEFYSYRDIDEITWTTRKMCRKLTFSDFSHQIALMVSTTWNTVLLRLHFTKRNSWSLIFDKKIVWPNKMSRRLLPDSICFNKPAWLFCGAMMWTGLVPLVRFPFGIGGAI